MTATRIPPIEVTGVFGALAKRMSKRMLGTVPKSLGTMWHNKPVLKAGVAMSRRTRTWRECERDLKSYAHMAVASLIGCSACLDFGYYRARNEGLDLTKAQQIPRWRESDVFTPLEREVLEYAEAMSQTPPTVTDEMSARLLEQLGAPALVELSAYIGLANEMTRTNVALGVEADGLAEACGLAPMAQRSVGSGSPASSAS